MRLVAVIVNVLGDSSLGLMGDWRGNRWVIIGIDSWLSESKYEHPQGNVTDFGQYNPILLKNHLLVIFL